MKLEQPRNQFWNGRGEVGGQACEEVNYRAGHSANSNFTEQGASQSSKQKDLLDSSSLEMPASSIRGALERRLDSSSSKTIERHMHMRQCNCKMMFECACT